jgi:ribonuclease HI
MSFQSKKDEFQQTTYHAFADGSFSGNRNKVSAAWVIAVADDKPQAEGVHTITFGDPSMRGSSLLSEIMSCALALKALAREIPEHDMFPRIVLHTDNMEVLSAIEQDKCRSAMKSERDPALKSAYFELNQALSNFNEYGVHTRYCKENSTRQMSRAHDLAYFATSREPKGRFVKYVEVGQTELACGADALMLA